MSGMAPNLVIMLTTVVVVLAIVVTSGASRHQRTPHMAVLNADSRGSVRNSSPSRRVKYENFDDYLLDLNFSRQREHNQVTKEESSPESPPRRPYRPAVILTVPTDDEDLTEGSGDPTAAPAEETHTVDATTRHSPVLGQPTNRQPPPQTNPATSLDILGYFRDVPRQHWSCCMLGKLAGDKGFHCYAGFYAARITTRNVNRAHNKKMHFHGPDRIPHWGENLMATFQRCVARHGDEFHKCCYAASIEKTERQRWSRYIDNQSRSHRLN